MASPVTVRRGFTLVELLVVIGIIGILVSLLLPAVQAVREAGNRIKCTNNVNQLAKAMQNYHNSHKFFPINWGACASADSGSSATVYGQSWLTGLLPYIEEDPLYKTIVFVTPGSNPRTPAPLSSNLAAATMKMSKFLCPSDSTDGVSADQQFAQICQVAVGVTNYKACAGSNWEGTRSGNHKYRNQDAPSPPAPSGGYRGRNATSYDGKEYGNGVICRGWAASVNPPTGKPILTSLHYNDIKDGTSNTLAIGETVPGFCNWAAWYWFNGSTATCAIPLNWEEPTVRRKDNAADFYSTACFMSRHPGGGNFGLCDGSTRFINDGIDLSVYRGLATIDGGEIVQMPD